MSQEWDRALHRLVSVDQQAYLDLVLPGLLRHLEHLPEKLKGSGLIVDALLRAEIAHFSEEALAQLPSAFSHSLRVVSQRTSGYKRRPKVLIHLESETYYNKRMPMRMLEYHFKAREQYQGEDVFSVVIHLLDDKRLDPSPLIWRTSLLGESRALEFDYLVVEMQDFTSDDIRRRGRAALLPLLSLAQDGIERSTVRGMFNDLRAVGNRDLLEAAATLARLQFERKGTPDDCDWLFTENPMVYDILHTEPLYSSIKREGRLEGIPVGIQQAVIALVTARFPKLNQLVQKRITKVHDPQRLQQLIPDLSVLPSEEQVEQVLISLEEDQSQESVYASVPVENPAEPPREQFLVETAWLADHLNDPQLRIVDMRGYVRITPRPGAEDHHDAAYVGAREEYEHEHIPGAIYIDWTRDIVDLHDHEVEAQIAPVEKFAEVLGQLGIGDQHLVVAYDEHPASQFATRLWWALNYYGHRRVVVLNGGLPKWRREERPLTSVIPAYPPASFTAVAQPSWRATAEDVLASLDQSNVKIIDARDHGQYSGKIARGEGRRGHIPTAINLPREELIDPATGTFRSNEDLRLSFNILHVSPDQHVIAYCNGGVAATTALFSLAMLGYPQLTNYDGSWNEWGKRHDLPCETNTTG